MGVHQGTVMGCCIGVGGTYGVSHLLSPQGEEMERSVCMRWVVCGAQDRYWGPSQQSWECCLGSHTLCPLLPHPL